MTRIFFKAALIVLFLLGAAFSVSAQTQDTLLNGFLKRYAESYDPPALVVGLSQNGKTYWRGAYGYANVELQATATPKSVFRFASISKFITAVAIMQLVERGRIGLDDDVRKHLPGIPKKRYTFTIRQILNHTSGLRTYRGNEFNSTREFNSTNDVIQYLAQDTLVYQPGTQTIYSTLSYAYLAAIIESVTKTSYERYITENIFKPAGMETAAPEFRKRIVKNRADGYTRNTSRELENAPLADLSIKFPGGGIIGTIDDLLNFGKALLEGKLIKKQTLELMTRPTFLYNGKQLNYGLGVSIQTDSSGRFFFGHNGSGTGFLSSVLLYPGDNVVAAYLTNINDRSLVNAAELCANTYFSGNASQITPPAWDVLMRSYKEDGIMTALSRYSELTASGQASTDDLISFGLDLVTLKKPDDALRALRIAASEQPQSAKVQLALGAAYRSDNNKGMALRHYRAALKLDPNNDDARKAIAELQK